MEDPVVGDDWIMIDDGVLDVDVDKEIEKLFGKLYVDKEEKKCYCGVDSVGVGIHSDYCPKYEK